MECGSLGSELRGGINCTEQERLGAACSSDGALGINVLVVSFDVKGFFSRSAICFLVRV